MVVALRSAITCALPAFLIAITVFDGPLLVAQPAKAVTAPIRHLEYAPAPLDNPLKGLVPYWQDDWYEEAFPCTMEFWYFPANELMIAPNQFNWNPLEAKLKDMQRRGHQAVLRIYLEFPGRDTGVPKYLLEQGVKLTRYTNNGKVNLTPDYNDERLVRALENLIVEFGKRYDGDPRIGFLTMGMLGHWGEWHTYPRGRLFASTATQKRIQQAFAASFKRTKVLMRYPAGEGNANYAANVKSPFGYHDDSFGWATLETDDPEDDWHFTALLRRAEATEKWKAAPIGGEIRPELWGCIFDDPSCAAKDQAFENCVQQTHASWLMDSGMYDEPGRKGNISQDQMQQRIVNAKRQVAKLGYELFVSSVSVKTDGDQHSIHLKVENRGVAPFYYDWPVQLAEFENLDANGPTKLHVTPWRLSQVLPDRPAEWKITIKRLPKRGLAIRVPNPMDRGKPLRFANQTQHENGWLVLEEPVDRQTGSPD